MDEIDFVKSQIIQLEHLVSMCEGHPIMHKSYSLRLEEFKERLTQLYKTDK